MAQTKGVMGRLGFAPVGTDAISDIVKADMSVDTPEPSEAKRVLDDNGDKNIVFVMPKFVGANDTDFDIETIEDLQSMLRSILKMDEVSGGDQTILSLSDVRLCYLLVQLAKDLKINIIMLTDFKGCDYSELWYSHFVGFDRISYVQLLDSEQDARIDGIVKEALNDVAAKPVFQTTQGAVPERKMAPRVRDPRPFNEKKVDFVKLGSSDVDPSDEMDEAGGA